jgi:hypothetical protein
MNPEFSNNYFANTDSVNNQNQISPDLMKSTPSMQAFPWRIIWKIIDWGIKFKGIADIFSEITRNRSIYQDMSSNAKTEIHGLEQTIGEKFALIGAYTNKLNHIPHDQVNFYVNKINTTRLEIARDIERLAGVIKGQLERLEKNSSNTYYDVEQLAIKLEKAVEKIRNDPNYKVPSLDNFKQTSQAVSRETIASNELNNFFEYKLNELSAYTDLSMDERISLTAASIWHQTQNPEVAAHSLIAYLSPSSDSDYSVVTEHLKVAQGLLESQNLTKQDTSFQLGPEMVYE